MVGMAQSDSAAEASRGNKILLPNLGMLLYSYRHALADRGVVDDIVSSCREAYRSLYGSLRGYNEPDLPPQSFHVYRSRSGVMQHIIGHRRQETDFAMAANSGREETAVLHQVEGLELLERRLADLGVPLQLGHYSDFRRTTELQRGYVQDLGGFSVLHERGYDVLSMNIWNAPPSMRPAIRAYQQAMRGQLIVN